MSMCPFRSTCTEAKRTRLGRGSAKPGLMARGSGGVVDAFLTCNWQCPKGTLAASKEL